MKKAAILSFVLLSFFAGQLLAQDRSDTLKIYYLDEVVITAQKAEAKLRDCSASVSLLSEVDIETSNSNSAVDVLNYLPGVFVQKTGNFGRADINIRGIGSRGRRVAVLINGKPEKMSLFGCAVTHSLPLSDVERVELVRGPASVLYGSDALGGVINIITKKREGAETDYTFSYGSFDTYLNRIRAGATLKDFDFYATADKRKSSGHLDNSAYDGEEYTLDVGYLLTDGIDADFTARYFTGHKEEPLPSPPGTWNDYERAGANLSLESEFSQDWKGELSFYGNWGEHNFSDGWHSKDLTYGVDFQLSGNLLESNNMILGSEWRHLRGERLSNPSGEWNRASFSVFAQDEQMIRKELLLSLGGRYSHDQISGDDFAAHAGLVLDLPSRTLLRLSVNKGFRFPQINELYMFPSSNEDLEPEKVWNYETGINQTIFSGVSLDLTGFIMKGDNLIEVNSNSSPPPMHLFQNTGEFNFKGMELGFRIEQRNLNGQVYYSHLDTQDKTQGRPEDKLSMKVRCSLERASFSLDGQYVWNYYAQDDHQEKIDEFFALNTKLSYKLASCLEFFAGVENILDEPYQIYVDLPSGSGVYVMPQRSFSVGFKITP
jgi:outer membrane cobalamin receptor